MKRHPNTVVSILIISCILLLTACSSKPNEDSANNAELKKQIAELQTEVSDLKSQLSEKAIIESTPSPSPTVEPTPTPILNPAIKLSSAVTVADFAVVTLKKTAFTKKVEPPKPDSYYTYYEIKDAANIYLDIVMDVKSLLSTAQGSEEFVSVKAMYDGKYEYNTFSTIEKSGGTDFTYTNITNIEPLKTRTLHFIAELPKEASTDKKPLTIIVTINKIDYTYTLR